MLKNAMDSGKKNNFQNRTPHMPSMEEIFNLFSAEEMIVPNEPLWF